MILDTFPELFLAGLGYPLTGVLVRWRANYNARPSENSAAHPAHRLSYFGTLMKVSSIEVSLDPAYVRHIMVYNETIIFAGSGRLELMQRPAVPTLAVMEFWELLGLGNIVVVAYLHYLEFYLSEIVPIAMICILRIAVTVPQCIFTNRAITTQQELPYLSLRKALKALLTPSERRRPYLLYLTPGLVAAHFAWTMFIVIASLIRHFVFHVRFFRMAQRENTLQTGLVILVWTIAMALNVLVLTPLEVAIVRLSIQGQPDEFEPVAYSLLPVEGELEDGGSPEASSGPKVIQLRGKEVPYTGFVDCMRRILEEEGWMVLYRGWWVTAFRGILLL
ncbi:hypothetical protein BV22DRAFT_1132592 [Leucogyrophana mollusca]|uniref:Uncharacterized protein n=1 Tax=Leucogyrophana mollusca TaxID=85980 RepID=A0ACB8B5R7_9AGAM|nr:hypothetical protein BV22DRAFT_1132592 [Leucogyrophana mollusca]